MNNLSLTMRFIRKSFLTIVSVYLLLNNSSASSSSNVHSANETARTKIILRSKLDKIRPIPFFPTMPVLDLLTQSYQMTNPTKLNKLHHYHYHIMNTNYFYGPNMGCVQCGGSFQFNYPGYFYYG